MKPFRSLLLSLCLWNNLLQAQVSVVPDDVLSALSLLRPDSSYATRETVPVTGQSFAQAVRVQTLREPGDPWGVQLNVRTSASIEAEDVLLATFSLRRVAPLGREAYATFIFEQASTPYTKSAQRTLNEGDGQWREFHVAFSSATNYAPGEAQINFQLGFEPQTIEIGGISIVNYGGSVSVDSLPNDYTYPDRGADAAWRAPAAARIDQHRKATLTVRVEDTFGQPIPGATVQVQMQEHAFGFGSAVTAGGILGTTTNDATYRDLIRQLFNKVVMENDLKWPGWESNPTRALDGVDWLLAQGIAVRGHNLIWPGWRNMPSDVATLTNDLPALRQRIDSHILEEAAALRGRLVDWDVINEPYSNHDVMDWLGNAEMIRWFHLARQADPQAVLYLNDYGILTVNSTNSGHQNHYFDTLAYVQASGAPIGGIGLQSHFGAALTPPPRLLEILDRFAHFGLDLQSTEFDISVADEQVQADYTRDFMTLLFSHPKVVGIVMWGFWEGRHWKPEAALFRRDWSIKPNGRIWRDLVFGQWWTDLVGQTGSAGDATVRAFKGRYEVAASLGTTSNRVALLLETNQNLRLVLPNLPPTAVLTAPSNHTSIAAGSALLLRGTLVGSTSAVSQIEFFAGTNRLGERAAAPASLLWLNIPPGDWPLYVVATLDGARQTSSVATVHAVQARTSDITLVTTGAVWRFSDEGLAPAPHWVSRTYDDSAWLAGEAQLGFGDGDEVTPIQRVNANGTTNITCYFRHTFPVANPEAVSQLTLRLLRDDGAVVYLNGAEIFRSNMPDGPTASDTFAASVVSGDAEGTFYSLALSPELLLEGYNVLAAEVHQANLGSSDLSFDLDLAGSKVFLAPTVTGHPETQAVWTEQAAAFEVTSLGTGPLHYQWYYNGTTLLPGATNRTLHLDNIRLGQAGDYSVVVWNPAGSVTSQVASLRVSVDLTAHRTLIPAGATWKYFDQGQNLGSPWRTVGYDDAAWPAGPAQLGYGDGDEATVVGFGPNENNKYITTYFRHHFEVPDAASITNLELRLLCDDGGSVYLNGLEVFRRNLPDGPIGYTTRASTSIGGGDESLFVSSSIPLLLLREGPNVLAAEIHQASPTSSDLSFDLALEAIAGGLPCLKWAPHGTDLTLRWPVQPTGFVLESSASLDFSVPWQPVAHGVSLSNGIYSVTFPLADRSRFFRLRRE